MKKLFALDRQILYDALETTREVNGLSDIIEYFNTHNSFKNVRISNIENDDDRLPPEWGDKKYYVVCDDSEGYERIIGLTNFYEGPDQIKKLRWESTPEESEAIRDTLMETLKKWNERIEYESC